MFGAPFGARASGGQSGVDSLLVRPIFPLNGGSFGAGTTRPLSDVPGGEKMPPASFFSLTSPWAWADGPQPTFRNAAIPRPRHRPRLRYVAISSLLRIGQLSSS